MNLSAILNATGARVDGVGSGTPAELAVPVSGIVVDSRQATPGSVFVALPGERADGHSFVTAALAAGARAAVVADTYERTALDGGAGPGGVLLRVPDTLRALHDLARYWRLHHTAAVIGITGSVGKTTTKEVVAGLLEADAPVLRSAANFNTDIGLSLTLVGLRAEHRAAVVEMGMYALGEIALLADIARPEIGIVTTVAPVHLERLGTIERIARAKSELPAALPASGLAILNGDNPWTRAMASTSTIAPSVLFGAGPENDLRATEVTVHGLDGVSFVLEAEGARVPIRTRIPGAHTVNAFLAAAAVARRLGLSWDSIRDAAEHVQLSVRQRIVRPAPGVLIIDDSYNAAPMSVRAALDLLGQSPGRKIAVLGDMLELGSEEETAHREVGRSAASVVDWLVVTGDRTAWTADEARRAGLPAERVQRVENNGEAVEVVQRIMDGSDGWSILVKGSLRMKMQEVVAGLGGTA